MQHQNLTVFFYEIHPHGPKQKEGALGVNVQNDPPAAHVMSDPTIQQDLVRKEDRCRLRRSDIGSQRNDCATKDCLSSAVPQITLSFKSAIRTASD